MTTRQDRLMIATRGSAYFSESQDQFYILNLEEIPVDWLGHSEASEKYYEYALWEPMYSLIATDDGSYVLEGLDQVIVEAHRCPLKYRFVPEEEIAYFPIHFTYRRGVSVPIPDDKKLALLEGALEVIRQGGLRYLNDEARESIRAEAAWLRRKPLILARAAYLKHKNESMVTHETEPAQSVQNEQLSDLRQEAN